MVAKEVSVIIPTYNGERKLPALLNSLINQTQKPGEIIVVVDGSSDNSVDVLNAYAQLLPSLRVIYQSNQGRAVVRNNGALAAKGSILVFLDDDIRLMPDGIEKHLDFHKANKECILFGRVMLDPSKTMYDDFSAFRAETESKSFFNIPRTDLMTISLDNYGFTSANLSCPKNVFLWLSGFDPKLNDSEDFDFSLRAFNRNIPILFNYALLGWHDDYVSLERYIWRQVQYVRSKQLLGILKPELKNMHPASFEYGLETSLLKRAVRKLFVVNKFWSWVIQTGLFRKILPIDFKHKIFDLIVTSSVIHKVNKSDK